MLLTGVSKFSKVNLFSNLNNLRNISLSKDYSGICGYAEPYRLAGKEVDCIGIEFSKAKRAIVGWEMK